MHSLAIRQWRFHLGDEPDAWAKGFDDGAWRTVTVPHDWSIEQPFAEAHSSGTGYLPGGIGWYRARLAASALGDLAGKHVRLLFHGVYKNAQVWVNGYHMGGRPSGYAAFDFDLTEILGYADGADLVVSVRVEHTDISDSRWYNGTGINRGVELQVHERVRIGAPGATFTTDAADASEATIRVAADVVNDTAAPVSVRVLHELHSLSSGRVHGFAGDVDVAPGASAAAVITGRVAEPELWSDTTPHLYRLETTLRWSEGGKEHQATYTDIVGIRTFRFDADRRFAINGESRILKGVCLHEDAGCLGTAVPAAVWLRRLLKLKEAGCNAVRMAHNPHAPELYRLCDVLGFFVIDEAFDEWENAKNKWWQGHNVYPPRHQGYAHDFHAWGDRDLAAMVDAHRNHASIIAWSIGNEIDYPNDPYASPLFPEMTGNNDARKTARQRSYDPNRPDARRLPAIARRLAAIVRERDPTRPVTIGAAYPELSTRTGLLDALDVAGYNYKEHLYDEDHRRFPRRPLLGTENGHRYGDWLAVADNDYVAGQFLWTGIDYLGEAHGWPIHGSGAGLLNLAGFDKPAFHLRRSWWSDTPTAHLVTRPHDAAATEKNFWSHPVARRWDGTGDGEVEILCFSNGEPRLSCGGEPVALTRDASNGYWVAVMRPRNAPLVLDTLVDGAVAASDELAPRGPAASLEAAVWQAPDDAAAGCSNAGLGLADIVQVECRLRDARGGLADDDRPIMAEVEGGVLLGLENGDLSDNTPYFLSTRATRDGRLIVYLRPAGNCTLRLTSPGLADVRVEVAVPG